MASVQILNADTLEGQLMECIERVAVAQGNALTNPNNASIVTSYTRNNLTGVLTVSITMATTDTIDPTTGGIKVEAEAVFID